MDDEARASRQKALAEKRRRLEEIKARRARGPAASQPPSSAAASASAPSPSSGAGTNLDSYIDELLRAPPSAAPPVEAAAPPPAPAPGGNAPGDDNDRPAATTAGEEPRTAAEGGTPAPSHPPPRPAVETYEIAVQCGEGDFPPPPLADEDGPPGPDEDGGGDGDDDDGEEDGGGADGTGASPRVPPGSSPRDGTADGGEEAPDLTAEERSKVLSSRRFGSFLSTAGRRVERLLGSSDPSALSVLRGSGWGPFDFAGDHVRDDDDERAGRRQEKAEEECYARGGYFDGRATYEHRPWTAGRHVADVQWCPGHGELILAGYGSSDPSRTGADPPPSNPLSPKRGGGGGGVPTVRHLSPHDPSSSSLASPPGSSRPAGVAAIYNLSMPGRPEHVFAAGCPILHTRFHPVEHPRLVLGGGTDGRLYVWDARAGRYPVQRSGAGGHDRTLVGMSVAGSGPAARVVTADSDGTVRYWSAGSLREPEETVATGANLSCLAALPGSAGTEGVVCGDERGGLLAVLAGTGRDGGGGGSAGGSSSGRVVRRVHPGGVLSPPGEGEEADPAAAEAAGCGHYGVVTSVAARPAGPAGRPGGKETTSSDPVAGAGDLLVTTGVDWTTKIWSPAYAQGGGPSRPLVSYLGSSYDYVSDAAWHPARTSVFVTSTASGTLSLWNLAQGVDGPVSGADGVVVDGSSPPGAGAGRVRWSEDGRRLAVAQGGRLHVLSATEEVWGGGGDEGGRVHSNLVKRGLIQE